LFELHADDPARFDGALAALDGGYDIDADGTDFAPSPLVLDRVG
jgi:thymidine phosphorylase